jgi:RNA recognition motif-containing protein
MEGIGKTREVKILISRDGRSSGRGVVEFVTISDMERCLKEVDGMDLDGRNIQVVNYLDKHSLRKSKGSTSEEETGGSETGRKDKTSPPPEPDPPHTYADTIKRGTPDAPNKKVPQGGGGKAKQGTEKPLSQSGPTPKPNLRYGLAAAENFKSGIKGMGLSQVVVKGDGWCLFHAMAIGLNRAGEGLEIMKEVTSEMRDNAEYYKGFMEDNQDLETHIRRIRSIGWAGEHEIRAVSKNFGRPIEIWELGIAGRPVIRKPYGQEEGSIKLAYYPRNHYNSLVIATLV